MNKERYQDWLDEIYYAKNRSPENTYMEAKYETAVKAVEMMGFDWKRNEKGEHKIYE